jgi:hypothetical protein
LKAKRFCLTAPFKWMMFVFNSKNYKLSPKNTIWCLVSSLVELKLFNSQIMLPVLSIKNWAQPESWWKEAFIFADINLQMFFGGYLLKNIDEPEYQIESAKSRAPNWEHQIDLSSSNFPFSNNFWLFPLKSIVPTISTVYLQPL